MNSTFWKDVSDIISNLTTTLGIIIGGGWAVWRFLIFREKYSKIQFGLNVNFIGEIKDKTLIEVISIIENKGLVRHWINNFKFDLLYLEDSDEIVEGDERINYQTLFKPIIKKRYWIPPEWINTFIDPNVKQEYTYVTTIPNNAKFILVFASFKYPDTESSFHTAQKVFKVERKVS